MTDTNLTTIEQLPSPTDPARSPDVVAFFAELRALQLACGDASDHDKIAVLITAIIDHGWDTKPRIVGTLVRLGLSGARAAKILDEYRGTRWRVDGSRRYRSLPG